MDESYTSLDDLESKLDKKGPSAASATSTKSNPLSDIWSSQPAKKDAFFLFGKD